MAKRDTTRHPATEDTSGASGTEGAPAPRTVSRRTIACAGCAGVFALGLAAAIVAITAWDAKDSRLYKGKPLPQNVAYIGRWITDGTIGACADTFAIAGDRIACDFSVRNDSKQPITVLEIGRTIIGPSLEARFSADKLPLELMEGDQPMEVTDDENVLGLQMDMFGRWILFVPSEAEDAPPAQPFTLKPGEIKRFRYRPRVYQALMPARALRIAVRLDDGNPPHPFYFLRQSAGIAGWFEKGVEKAVEGSR